MFDSVINYLDKFGPEILVIQFGFLVIICTLFLWLWFSNRRKYHNLKHAIPANVVKSYLDSIIQNSTSLKSSLFRGGGLEVSGVPSVMPLGNLVGGDSMAVSGAPSAALMEELNQKKAQIALLETQLSSLQNAQKELMNQKNGSSEALENKIKELEALLAQARGGAGDETIKAELNMVTKERDDIRDRLKEFEIIADDLANLKRLQQENEQLKRSLAAKGGTPAPAKTADVSDILEDLAQPVEAKEEEAKVLKEALAEPEAPVEEVAAAAPSSEELPAPEPIAAAPEEEKKSKSEKTPEDLLSEFEKMLG